MSDKGSAGRRKPQGVVLYRGPSLIDGGPVAAVAVNLARRSRNRKTGNMVGTFILADGAEGPVEAARSGADRSVCGDCPHRAGTCYVNLSQAPSAVHRALLRGRYPTFTPREHLRLFEKRLVRLGSYGDPAAVPFRTWELLTNASAGWTCYTHQWRWCDQRLARLCMASVETPCQRQEAVRLGWRTFRVRLAEQPLLENELACPASEEAGRRLTCSTCLACSGNLAGSASPAIVFHGPTLAGNWKLTRFQRQVEALQEQEHRRTSLPLTT
jgi:hypothetical protein